MLSRITKFIHIYVGILKYNNNLYVFCDGLTRHIQMILYCHTWPYLTNQHENSIVLPIAAHLFKILLILLKSPHFHSCKMFMDCTITVQIEHGTSQCKTTEMCKTVTLVTSVTTTVSFSEI